MKETSSHTLEGEKARAMLSRIIREKQHIRLHSDHKSLDMAATDVSEWDPCQQKQSQGQGDALTPVREAVGRSATHSVYIFLHL